MVDKTYIPEGQDAPASQIGATLEALAATIASRRDADEASYTYRLLTGNVDTVLKKVMEESGEVALAAKDVEGWATSSLAAAVALQAASDDSRAETDADALSVQLPPEYGEAVDHLRYEAADVVYHLLVVLERYGIGLDEFAAELNNRMTERERPRGGVRLYDEYVRRGK
ncbi:phosphoribosyl-ATP diphosphatase [Adlercreutzia sp. R25]|uniref:phosphoribosyl-ATP pyrophosphatase n=1 Tax=Adlercreutzia shanghongiae TaxID=3111773 RepID=UPI002DBA7469|nr:phosphoribosyl-ATP diphosphatase [Adlercreutzia sp. R25]MEC4273036.1 phosphoribosyl-ATP diphosphatase [Adlercreutzia sp. R25]